MILRARKIDGERALRIGLVHETPPGGRAEVGCPRPGPRARRDAARAVAGVLRCVVGPATLRSTRRSPRNAERCSTARARPTSSKECGRSSRSGGQCSPANSPADEPVSLSGSLRHRRRNPSRTPNAPRSTGVRCDTSHNSTSARLQLCGKVRRDLATLLFDGDDRGLERTWRRTGRISDLGDVAAEIGARRSLVGERLHPGTQVGRLRPCRSRRPPGTRAASSLDGTHPATVRRSSPRDRVRR